jgi:hypothetical protein
MCESASTGVSKMNKTLSTILTVFAVVILAGGLFFAGSMFGRVNSFGPSMMFNRNWDNDNSYGPRMMNGQGGFGMMNNFNNRGNSYGPGMMNGQGGMMNGYNANTVTTPLTVDQAKAAAEKYLAALNNSDLQIAEVMIFDNNAYAVVKEISTGKGAFELLVDPSSQIAYPEHGPNMMWNVKYSDMNHENMMSGRGGMMNGYQWNNSTTTDVTAEMTVTSEQASEYAQTYLDANISGATAATDPIEFYGYYTLDFEKDGKVAGMLSVNGYTGQVFLHTWPGTFIEEAMTE